MLAVIDTNILVSALWSKNGAPARILSLIISGRLIPCYDYRILSEYKEVIIRPKFKFTASEVSALLDWITDNGRSVVAEPLNVDFTEEADCCRRQHVRDHAVPAKPDKPFQASSSLIVPGRRGKAVTQLVLVI